MEIDESELKQSYTDAENELYLVNTRKTKIKEILKLCDTIKLTGRTIVIPAVLAVPAVMREDNVTIKVQAIQFVPETTEEIFDVYPVDKNLGSVTMEVLRRETIYDNILSKRAELGF